MMLSRMGAGCRTCAWASLGIYILWPDKELPAPVSGASARSTLIRVAVLEQPCTGTFNASGDTGECDELNHTRDVPLLQHQNRAWLVVTVGMT